MKITFLGTGAADWDWSRYGEENVGGAAATLRDDCLLVDCGLGGAVATAVFPLRRWARRAWRSARAFDKRETWRGGAFGVRLNG